MRRLLNQFLSTVQLALRRTWTALGSHVAIALGVLVATHDRTVYDFATVVYELENGQLTRHTGFWQKRSNYCSAAVIPSTPPSLF